MVTKLDEAELNRLESQVEHGGGGAWDYLCLVRKLKVRRSDKVLKHGLLILNDPKKRSVLGDEEWTLFEQVAIASMDCNSLDTAGECIKVLSKKFPESNRVGRLQALLLEAKGCWEEAEKAYSSLLEADALDQVIHKRRVAMAKAQGDILKAIDWLNKYLDIFMADHDAWRELAEIYVSLQMYKQAAFCYEELILAQPTVLLYHLAYADVLYTLGGLENLQTAKKYYASTIDLSGGKNTRALYGICLEYMFLLKDRHHLEWTHYAEEKGVRQWVWRYAIIPQQSQRGCSQVILDQKRISEEKDGMSRLWYKHSPVNIMGNDEDFQCTSAIGQLTKGRNKEEKDSVELHSLAAAALEKDYKYRAPNKLPLLTSTLKSLKISS